MVVVGSRCAGREPVQDPRRRGARTNSVPAGTPICEGRVGRCCVVEIVENRESETNFDLLVLLK